MAQLLRGLWLVAMILTGAAAAAAGDAPGVEYLYIEANEGGSSGGHVALRLGEEVFDFEHRPPGVLVLGEDDFEHFRYRYAVLRNRAIHGSRIAVSGETYGLLVDHFRRRLFLQGRHLDIIQGLGDDRTTIGQMLSGSLAIEAAGLFVADGGTVGSDPDIADLRASVEATYGRDFLERRRELLAGRLAALDPRFTQLPELPDAADRPPAPTYSFAQRYRDIATQLAALEVLRDARPLASGAARPVGSNMLEFTAADAEAVRQLSGAQSLALVRLVASERPDWGTALTVGMARLIALRESARLGQWVVRAPFSVVEDTDTRHRLAAHPDLAAELLEDATYELARSRERLVTRTQGGAFHETDLAAFEAVANRSLALRAAPVAPLHPWLVSVQGLDREALRASLAGVREREDDYTVAFKRRWGYQLLTRNCVSELFSEIDAAFEGGAGESATRLGGRLQINGSLNFIPAVSAAGVAAAYPVTDRLELQSYRHWRIGQMYERENPVTVYLRESNTLTSAIYRRNPNDSTFVFFTDDAVATRPLFGAVNLAAALGASAVGLVKLPVDGGAMLWSGVRGAFFSLPELFFQNIRKGSFEYVGRDALAGFVAE